MKRLLAISALALTATAAIPDAAEAQDNRNRLVGYLAMGFGGEATIDPDGLDSFDVELDPTVGLGFRYEILMGKLFSIAPMIEWLTYEFDVIGSDREHLFDFDVFLKFRGVIRAGPRDIELYGGIPIGFSVATLDNEEGAGLGFNLGVMGGAAIFFGKFGLFFEIGWRMHQIWEDDVRIGGNQAGMNLGGMLRL